MTVLNEYISRTIELRGNTTKLLISYVKPHESVSTDTIARWLRSVMEVSGIDVSISKVHSCRSASTSKAEKFVPIDVVKNAGGWGNVSTFRKFYDKPITVTFADSVLDSGN